MKTDSTVEDSFEGVQRQLEFVPNLHKELSKAPAVLGVYQRGLEALSGGSLTPKEQQVVQLTVAVYNDCLYCKKNWAVLKSKVSAG